VCLDGIRAKLDDDIGEQGIVEDAVNFGQSLMVHNMDACAYPSSSAKLPTLDIERLLPMASMLGCKVGGGAEMFLQCRNVGIDLVSMRSRAHGLSCLQFAQSVK